MSADHFAKETARVVAARSAEPHRAPGRSAPGRITRSAHAHRAALAIAVGLYFKGQRFALNGLAAIAREGADVDKDVLSAVIGHDEAEAAFGIPFL